MGSGKRRRLIAPAFLRREDAAAVTEHVRLFGAPVVTRGLTWLPLLELLSWPLLYHVAGQRRPARGPFARLGASLLAVPFVLGWEWGHNFAHAAGAWLVGKPADAIRIIGGTPALVYYDVADARVTPRQHVARALGGPLFNLAALLSLVWLRPRLRPGTLLRELAGVSLVTNLALLAGALTPLPFLDGGVILKWGLVARGHSREDADQTARRANGLLGIGAGLLGFGLLRRRRRLYGGLALGAAALFLAVARDRLRVGARHP
jgi:hypothetical protein